MKRNLRHQFQSDVVIRDECKQKENAGRQKDLEVGVQPKKYVRYLFNDRNDENSNECSLSLTDKRLS